MAAKFHIPAKFCVILLIISAVKCTDVDILRISRSLLFYMIGNEKGKSIAIARLYGSLLLTLVTFFSYIC